MKMPMQYLVDIHNTQNTASLQNFLKNDIDLSNNFFPGIDKSIGGKVQTYYTKAPYMLSANTAWLVPNTTHAPLNEKRKAQNGRRGECSRPLPFFIFRFSFFVPTYDTVHVSGPSISAWISPAPCRAIASSFCLRTTLTYRSFSTSRRMPIGSGRSG